VNLFILFCMYSSALVVFYTITHISTPCFHNLRVHHVTCCISKPPSIHKMTSRCGYIWSIRWRYMQHFCSGICVLLPWNCHQYFIPQKKQKMLATNGGICNYLWEWHTSTNLSFIYNVKMCVKLARGELYGVNKLRTEDLCEVPLSGEKLNVYRKSETNKIMHT